MFFFDGDCNFCNQWANWILHLDKKQKIFIAPLQGETASRILPGQFTSKNLETIVLYENSRLFQKSGAVFRLARILGGPLVLFLAFCWLPRKWTDGVYDFVARNRHLLMKQRENCRIPTENEKSHFLD